MDPLTRMDSHSRTIKIDETNIFKASWNNLYFDNARRSFEQILRIQQMRYILLLRYLQEIIFEYNRFNQI